MIERTNRPDDYGAGRPTPNNAKKVGLSQEKLDVILRVWLGLLEEQLHTRRPGPVTRKVLAKHLPFTMKKSTLEWYMRRIRSESK